MLSICIPIYNKSILSLIDALYKQCIDCKIHFEIICIDDASNSLYKAINKKSTELPNVVYFELQENVGRAVIRNILAQKATYNHLLYIDCDVRIPSSNFIARYVSCIQRGTPVAVGGILYDENFIEQDTSLHFKYGTKRESRSARLRNKNPYSSFLTGNLLLQTKIVQEIQFLSTLKDYGHEDTLFCIELKKKNIPVLHIDNPAIHEGLETNEIFVQKQLTAVKNLSSLIKQGHDMKGISLYDAYLCLKKYYLPGIFTASFGLIRNKVFNRLVSGKSQWLALFDVLRLYELSKNLKSNQNN